jgi:hypothetical protein
MCFYAKQNQRAIPDCADIGCRRACDSLLAFLFVQNKAFRVHGVHEMFSPDENGWGTRARQDPSEVTANGSGADNGDSRPVSNFAHQTTFDGPGSPNLYVE